MTKKEISVVLVDDHIHFRNELAIVIGGFGEFTAVGGGLAYVALDQVKDGPRGPLDLSQQSKSAIWFWDVAGGPRASLVEAQSTIGTLAH